MATSQSQSNSLAEEIKKLEQQLAEKTALLNKQQFEKIDLLITNFVNEVEKNGFNKVEVKKAVVQKLTRKHKPRK
jgi:GTPase involved in cell partitioning and DNA repair